MAVLAFCLGLSPSKAHCQNVNVYAWSAGQKAKHKDYEGALADLAKAIQSEPASAEKWYVMRAQIEDQMDRVDDGIGDCNAALRLKADDPAALSERGFLHIVAGDLDGAVGDLTQAITQYRPDPAKKRQLSHTYAELGIALEAKGSLADAQGAFESAVGAATDDGAYTRFYLSLLLRKQGKPDAAGPYLADVPSWKEGWSKSVGLFLSNRTAEEALISEAEHADKIPVNDRLCEAYYYAGMQRMLSGDTRQAAALLAKSVATGVKHYNEYSMARYELERLEPPQK